MEWGRSYTATWRIFRVNRLTWADAEQIDNIDSVSITRTADGNLLESGGLEVTGNFEPDYYRIVMTAEQGGDTERVDVATMLFDVTGGNYDYNTTEHRAEGRSVLYPASKTAIVAGEYAPAGVDGAQYAADLLQGAINAPVQVEGHFVLNDHIVHEIGSYVIDAVWAVLNAGNFIMQIDGRGVVHIKPKPSEPSLVLDNASMSLLENGVSYSTDIGDIPNRYIVIDGANRTIAINDDPDSIASTVRRGYFVDYVDEAPTPIDGETRAAYAERQLELHSVLHEDKSYTREFAAGVLLYSIVRASINGLEGDLRVMSQTVSCGNGITVSERAIREEQLWQRT